MEHSLEVFSEGALIFCSNRKWLHPLFELERFLAITDYESHNLIVKDKIVGRAAALLLIRLRIGYVKADIMSKLGKEALDKYGIKNECDSFVDSITCGTEEILMNEYDHEKAYDMLKKQASL